MFLWFSPHIVLLDKEEGSGAGEWLCQGQWLMGHRETARNLSPVPLHPTLLSSSCHWGVNRVLKPLLWVKRHDIVYSHFTESSVASS